MDDLTKTDQRLAGEWWLPTHPGEKRAGELTFSPGEQPTITMRHGWQDPPETTIGDDTHVQLIDTTSVRPAQTNEILRHAVVHGETVTATPKQALDLFSLLDIDDVPGLGTRRGEGPGSYIRNLVGQLLIEGAHVKALEELSIVSIAFTHSAPRTIKDLGFTNSTTWTTAPDTGGSGYDLGWRQPDPIELTITRDDADIDLEIRVGMDRSQNHHTKEITVSPVVFYSLKPTSETILEPLWDNFGSPLEAFIRFISSCDGGWSSIWLNAVGHRDTLKAHHRELREHDDYTASAPQPLFFLDTFPDELPTILQTWYDHYRNYGQEIEIGLRALADRPGRERVRRLIVAIEGLIDDKRCAKRATLQWRLETLVQDVTDHGVDFPDDFSLLTGKAKKIRNDESHGQANPGKRPKFTPTEVREANMTAAAALNALLLCRIGVPPEGVTSYLKHWNKGQQ